MRRSFFAVFLSRQMFERETRREKIVETKLREMKLKNQTSDKPADAAVVAVVQAQIAEAEARMNQEMEKELLEFLETVVNYILLIYTEKYDREPIYVQRCHIVYLAVERHFRLIRVSSQFPNRKLEMEFNYYGPSIRPEVKF